MKSLLKSFGCVVFAFLVSCGKPDLNDSKTLEQITEKAIFINKLQIRGNDSDKLVYAPNSQTPYTGWAKRIYDNGQVAWLTQYKDGKMHGPNTHWHENGQKSSESNYSNGKAHGISTGWYKNGQKKYVTNYKDGKQHGLDSSWSENGQKLTGINRKDGKEAKTEALTDEEILERMREDEKNRLVLEALLQQSKEEGEKLNRIHEQQIQHSKEIRDKIKRIGE